MSWKGKQAYREFLGTDFWKELSAAAIARDGKCVRCGDEKRLQAHHKFYRKDWQYCPLCGKKLF